METIASLTAKIGRKYGIEFSIPHYVEVAEIFDNLKARKADTELNFKTIEELVTNGLHYQMSDDEYYRLMRNIHLDDWQRRQNGTYGSQVSANLRNTNLGKKNEDGYVNKVTNFFMYCYAFQMQEETKMTKDIVFDKTKMSPNTEKEIRRTLNLVGTNFRLTEDMEVTDLAMGKIDDEPCALVSFAADNDDEDDTEFVAFYRKNEMGFRPSGKTFQVV